MNFGRTGAHRLRRGGGEDCRKVGCTWFIWGFEWGSPIAGWFMMEHPFKLDDLGVLYPYFGNPPHEVG